MLRIIELISRIVAMNINMWQRILHLFRRPTEGSNLLFDFEDSLMLIVDPEQLTNNLLSKLQGLIKTTFLTTQEIPPSIDIFFIIHNSQKLLIHQ